MSKRLLSAGIELFRNGDIVGAHDIISKLDRGFVRKRLIHEVSSKTLDHESSVKIWNISFPENTERFVELLCSIPENKKIKTVCSPEEKQDHLEFASPPRSRRISIDYPDEFIEWINVSLDKVVSIDRFEMAQPWGLAGIAALARRQAEDPLEVILEGTSSAGRFAYALGMPELIEGVPAKGSEETGRTVKMRRISQFNKIEPAAYDISNLLINIKNDNDKNFLYDPEETRKTIYYVIVELLRNVMQHSHDRLGAVAVAQNMSVNRDGDQIIQVAVADNGIGIFDALRGMHEEISTPGMALERALWPYFSGAFDKTKKGTSQNAGLGLFFVSEMAKLTAGTLFISSRGASLLLKGDSDGEGNNQINIFDKGYPGTLVVFELPRRGVADHNALISTIIDRAEQRNANRVKKSWIKFDNIPRNTFVLSVEGVVENTVEAEKFSNNILIPKINNGTEVVIDFKGIKICTQSFLHSLLFSALRQAVNKKVKIYAINVTPPVKDGLRLLEIYAIDESVAE